MTVSPSVAVDKNGQHCSPLALSAEGEQVLRKQTHFVI
jgi:hypothetical protein